MNRLNLIMMMILTLVVSIPATAAITHRYDFVNDANDVVGGLESVLELGAYVQDGSLVLEGGDPGPRLVLDGPGIGISGYTEGVSVEAWFTLDVVDGWNRLFDFGSTNAGDLGEYYWFYTPSSGADPADSRLVISDTSPGYDSEEMVGSATIAIETEVHLVCTYDPVAMTMSVYENGFLANSEPVTKLLSDVNDLYAYIGSATYVGDPEFNGSVNEFRIYNKPLNAAEVVFTNHFGPDDAKEIALRSLSPADGDDQVNAEEIVTLSWTPESWVDAGATYNVYVGTDPNLADPNIATDDPLLPGYANVVNQPGVVGTSWDVTAETLPYDATCYWRVDTVQEDTTEYQGAGMMFATLPDAPYFIDPVPAVVVADENDNVSITVNAGNTDTYKWYKEGAPEITLSTTDTLALTGVTEAEAGNYYCDISFGDDPAVTSDPIKVVARLLIAHWPFEDTLADATANGWDGTAMSTVTSAAKDPNFAPGRIGQALDLKGVETYIDIVDGVQDDVRSGLTWSVWTYPRTAANWARFLSFNNGEATDNIFFARIGTGATVRFDTLGGVLDAENALEQNVWQMLTVTMSSTGEAALYKNGAQIAAGTIGIPTVVARTNNWIGRSAWPDALYDGLLDDIRIYNHALTSEEVALLYTETTPEDDYVCLSDAENPLTYDVNNDCRVNLLDVVDMAALWLECERIPAGSCSWID